jgi:erythritol transport system ATP-binding protein
MSALAADGYGVLFVSSELAEVMSLADRVLVMARGHVTAELSGAALTEEALVTASASDRVLAAVTASSDEPHPPTPEDSA